MRLILLMAVLTGVAAGQVPKKAVPLDVSGDTVVVVKSFPVVITAPAGGRDYTWLYPSSVDAVEDGNTLKIASAPKGSHKVRVKILWVDLKRPAPDDVRSERGETVINVGDLPGPKPIDPPPPTPDPKPADGPLRVLIVYESADLAKLPAAQQSVIYGKAVRGWLDENCAPDGTVKAWRMWDADVDASGDAAHWKAILARPRASLPFVHVMRGDAPAYEGPLPGTPTDTIAALSKAKGGK